MIFKEFMWNLHLKTSDKKPYYPYILLATTIACTTLTLLTIGYMPLPLIDQMHQNFIIQDGVLTILLTQPPILVPDCSEIKIEMQCIFHSFRV